MGSSYWRPLALASYWLDTRLGPAPRALHLGNVLLHALAGALLAVVLLRRLGAGAGPVPVAVAAGWWILHPENVEETEFLLSERYEYLVEFARMGRFSKIDKES